MPLDTSNQRRSLPKEHGLLSVLLTCATQSAVRPVCELREPEALVTLAGFLRPSR